MGNQIKERIRIYLRLSETDFEKYRVALVQNSTAQFLDEEKIETANLSTFRTQSDSNDNFQRTQGMLISSKSAQNLIESYIGLEHANKDFKRPRYNIQQSIKIYN